MPKKFSFGFVCDPLDGFNREAETTLFWMKELDRLGHSLFVFESKNLFLKQKEVWGQAKQITMTGHPNCFYRTFKEAPKNMATLDCLFLRKDPPFDLAYFHHLLLLSKVENKVLCINSPMALLKHNEKLAALDFPFTPKTYVGSQIEEIIAWGEKQKGGVVIKPLNDAGGRDVYRLNPKDLNRWLTKRLLRRLTWDETSPILVQEFLPATQKGDKRILLWMGKVLGQFLRIPKAGEFRANLHLGGSFHKCSLTVTDRKVIRALGPWSMKEKLYFAGFDMIGNHLTEINVTSPMGIREVNQLYGKKIEQIMIRDILKRL